MSLASLDEEHLASLEHALANILSTPLAEFTYAQIVDGMPTSDTYTRDHWRWFRDDRFYEGIPARDHPDLCPGTMDKTRAFRSELDINSFKFEHKTTQAYQNTTPGSVAFKLRLLELVVIACHDIAVFLYQLDDGAHKHAEWETWHKERLESLAEKDPENTRIHHCTYGPPTPFYRIGHMFSEGYPNGLADVAGYWAEYHIFGGVVLFDRGESEEECNGIYLDNREITDTLAPPTEKQFNNLVDFLLSPISDADPSRCPLPILITQENKWRWHAYDGMVDYNIFKFRHEIPNGPRQRDHCVIRFQDWPELDEQQTMEQEGRKELRGGVCDEGLMAACRERMKRISTPTSRCYRWDDEEQSRLQPDPKKQGRPPYFFDP